MKTKSLFLLPALVAVLNLIPAGRATAQTFTTLHSFTATTPCCPLINSDGADPRAGLLSLGNTLYGTAYQGGSLGNGTVFAVNADGTGFTTLHHFRSEHYRVLNCFSQEACISACAQFGGGGVCWVDIPYNYCECNGYSDGANPVAGLILSGNTLYGTASSGGSSAYGTVFKVNTNGTGFTNLYSFIGGDAGANPYAGLILSSNTLYGTAQNGGFWGWGAVFAVNTDGTGFTSLHAFTGGSDGAYPEAGFILSGNTLYGTTLQGGSSGKGTVFAVNTDGTGFTNLHDFTGSDGATPYGGLILSGNTLYGTASAGGGSGKGTLFALNTDGTGFTNLHNFAGYPSDGASPYGGLISAGNTLYGTASAGGSSSNGTLFAVNTDGTGFTNLHSFTALVSNTNSDGATPYAGLILSGSTLYGTASAGGSSSNGTVFSLSFQPQLTITRSGPYLMLSWPANVSGFDYTGYRLQRANAISGSFADVPGATSPYFIPITSPQQFFRLVQ